MRLTLWLAAMAFAFAAYAADADFGSKGGPEPANINEIIGLLRQDPYDLELLISFGTSKGGSAGHLALAIRDQAPGDDLVYSANFYADRTPKHAQGFYIDDLMARIPLKEYLFKTVSSLGDAAAFGLDFGEIYKRSVIGVRVYGVPVREKEALAAYFMRINDDFHNQVAKTEYHDGEIRYDYMNLNCAKTIGAGFKYGAGYSDLVVKDARFLSRLNVVRVATANIPSEMAVKLLKEWNTRGYGMDVVLYKKYDGSTYVDPHDEEKVAFKDLPNRFPSVLSLDFRSDAREYEDFDNLFAMYLFYYMNKYSVKVNDATKRLEIEPSTNPMSYTEAAALATKSAKEDSKGFLRRALFRSWGMKLGGATDNTRILDAKEKSDKQAAPSVPVGDDTRNGETAGSAPGTPHRGE